MVCELEWHVRTYFLILSDCFCYVSILLDAQLNDAVCKMFITISSNKVTFKCVSVRDEYAMYKMMKTSANAFQYNKLNFTHNRVESQESRVKKLREKSEPQWMHILHTVMRIHWHLSSQLGWAHIASLRMQKKCQVKKIQCEIRNKLISA